MQQLMWQVDFTGVATASKTALICWMCQIELTVLCHLSSPMRMQVLLVLSRAE